MNVQGCDTVLFGHGAGAQACQQPRWWPLWVAASGGGSNLARLGLRHILKKFIYYLHTSAEESYKFGVVVCIDVCVGHTLIKILPLPLVAAALAVAV